MSRGDSPRKEGINPAGIAVSLALFIAALSMVLWAAGRSDTTSISAAADKAQTVAQTIAPHAPAPVPAPKPVIKPEKTFEPVDVVLDDEPLPKTETAIPAAAAPANPKKSIESPPPDKTVKAAAPETRKPAAPVVKIEKVEPEKQPSRLIAESELMPAGEAEMPPEVEKLDAAKVSGKTIMWYSVRVGYTDSRLRADILRDVLREQGFPRAETVDAGQGTFFVSLGDFIYRYQAEELAGSVESKTSLSPKIFEKTVAK